MQQDTTIFVPKVYQPKTISNDCDRRRIKKRFSFPFITKFKLLQMLAKQRENFGNQSENIFKKIKI